MTPIRYTVLLLLLCLFAGARTAQAQCSANAVATNVTCFGLGDGSIDLTASNGTAPYTYLWSNNATTDDLNGLVAGTYTVTVTDALACTATVSVAVTEPAPLEVTAVGGTVNCAIVSIAFQTTATGGTPPYNYLWSNGETTEEPVIFSPGTYTVTVTDAQDCTATAMGIVWADVVSPYACVAPPGVLNCYNAVVTLNATCSSIGPNFSYQWSTNSGNFVNGTTTLTPTVNATGIYNLVVSNTINACTAITSVVVLGDFIIPGANAGPDKVLSCSTTSVTADGSSPNGPQIIYLWTTLNGHIVSGATTVNPIIDQPGTYKLLVTNLANGCTNTDQMVVTGNANPPIAIAGPDTGFPCGGGTATLNSTGSSVGAQFTYLWTGPGINVANQFALNPTVAAPGTYSLLVMNNVNGCTATDQVTVFPGPAIPDQNFVIQKVSCKGNDGAIDMTFSAGVAPYIYQWPNGMTTEDLDTLNPGIYSITLTDASSCNYYANVAVAQDAPLSILLSSVNPSDCSTSNGSISLVITGGRLPYTYLWSNGATIEDLTDLFSGLYNVTVTDAAGCTKLDSKVLLANVGLSAVVTSATCFGSDNGSINLSASGSTGPYIYQWTGPNGFTSIQEDPTNLSPGTYAVTATDVNGCLVVKSFLVTQPPAAFFSAGANMIACFGAATGSAAASITGGLPPYSYLWSTGETTLAISDLFPGTYSVTVTDSNGCMHFDNSVTVWENDQILLSFLQISSTCDQAVVVPIVSGGTTAPNYIFNWSSGSQDSVLQTNISGDYTLTVTDGLGCTASATYSTQVNFGFCGQIQGRVYHDVVENCLPDGEPGLGGWIMKAQGISGTFFGVTNASGAYTIGVLPGDYTVVISPPNPLWNPCSLMLLAGPVGVNDTVSGIDFPVKKDANCPSLSVDISSSILRRCFANNLYYVNYCNSGPDKAFGAYIILTLDPFLTPLNSNLAYTNLGNGVLRFEVGDLELGQCGSFYLYIRVSCNAVLGQTHCTEAHIYPDDPCIPPNAQWSGASLRVSSECQSDSLRFRIENVGASNMPAALEYIVIEDQVMLMSAPVKLDAGAFTTVSVPANGSTWRLEVEQEPFHPGHFMPAVSVEGCTTGPQFSTGFVTMFPANDADQFVDITCIENTAAYDPNDKQAFPKGYGAQHYVRPGTPLEYQIRFQNTGNDTAFTVRVVDTLTAWLDPVTIRPGASSHPYSWDLSGAGVLTFLFENILLADSNVNEPASHGFFKFTINHHEDAPLETVIENTAEIYFDFNEAIVTNTTFHRLGENFVTVGLWEPQQLGYKVLVSPNPFFEAAILEVKGLSINSPIHLQVFDLHGKLHLEMDSDGPVFQLKKGRLAAGAYFFKIEQAGKNLGTGKLVIQD